MTSLPPQPPEDPRRPEAPRPPAGDERPLTRREAREQYERRQAAAAAGNTTGAQPAAPVPPDAPPTAPTAPADASAADAAPGAQPAAVPPAPAAPTAPEPAPSLAWNLTPEGSTPALAPEATPRPKRRRRWLTGLITTVVILGLIGGGGLFAWNVFQPQVQAVIDRFQPHDYSGDGSGSVDVTIAQGDSGSNVASALEKAGVVKDGNTFYRLLLSTQPAPVFQPGVYRLHEKMSAQSALKLLQSPASKVEKKLTIPEGESENAVLAAAAKATGLSLDELKAAASDPSKFGLPAQAKTLEGFLFPATYTFDPDVTAVQVVQTLVDRAKQAFADDGVPADKLWDDVILASIVQREAGPNPQDLGKIARVFDNRLEQGMRLQSDATVAYGTGHTDTVWTTDEERADSSNPYNTYAHDGLPVGPIGNPGDGALKAVVTPTPGPWLYFTVVNLKTGETEFSQSEADHEVAAAKLQAWCAASADNEKYCQ